MPNTFYYLLIIGTVIFIWIMYMCISRLNYLINKHVTIPQLSNNENVINVEQFHKVLRDYDDFQLSTRKEYERLYAEIERLKSKENENEAMSVVMARSIILQYLKHSSTKSTYGFNTYLYPSLSDDCNLASVPKYGNIHKGNINPHYHNELLNN